MNAGGTGRARDICMARKGAECEWTIVKPAMGEAFPTVCSKFIVERPGHIRQDIGHAQSLGRTRIYELKDADVAWVGGREVDYCMCLN